MRFTSNKWKHWPPFGVQSSRRPIMRILILALWLVAGAGKGMGAELETINPEAEKLYAEGSYARAREVLPVMFENVAPVARKFSGTMAVCSLTSEPFFTATLSA